MNHEYLAIAIRSGPDANGRDTQSLGNDGCQFPRHALDQQGKSASVFDRLSVGEQVGRRLGRPSLHPVAAQGVERLRCQSDVATTGISAFTIRRISAARFFPPSIFTASAPPSLRKRTLVLSASPPST